MVDMTPDQKLERIKKALDRSGSHHWSDVRALLEKGECQIFDGEHGVWITEIRQAPRARALHCWIVAGELPGVMSMQAAVEKYALAHGCQKITAGVRKGWRYIAREYGWKETGLMIEKDLRHE